MIMAAKHPYIKWADRTDAVFVTLDIQDCEDAKITITEDAVEFSGVAPNSKVSYSCKLILKAKIMPDDKETTHAVKPRNVVFHLKKKEEERWGCLLADRKKMKPFIKADFDLWADSDEEAEKGGFDMSQFGGGGPGGPGGMPGMGGMGGMGGMPGMEGMGGMPGGMGGMGGMPGMEGMGGMPPGFDPSQMGGMMGGPDSDDEDEEEAEGEPHKAGLADLEGEVEKPIQEELIP